MQSREKILLGCPLFRAFRIAQLPHVLAYLGATVEKRYPMGAIVFRPGDTPKSGVLLDGELQIRAPHDRRPVRILSPGDLFADAEFRTDYSYTLVASDDVIYLPFSLRNALSRDDSPLRMTLLSGLLTTFADEVTREETHRRCLAAGTAREKVLLYLIEEARRQKTNRFRLPMTEKSLAAYLSLNRSTVVTTLTALKSAGYIQTDGADIILVSSVFDN